MTLHRSTPFLAIAFVTALCVSTRAQAPRPQQLPPPPDVAAAPADASVTSTGLASRVLSPGTGTEHPTAASTVKVHYSGWTTDGQMFDSSVVRGETIAFALRGVIRGWTEGVQLMVKGEKRRFWIPGALAYGDNPRPGAPKGMLVFDIELFEMTTPTAAPMHLAGYDAHKKLALVSPYKLIPAQPIGPTNLPGRMTSIAVADVAGVRSIYVGSAGGGVWKSSNRGLTWRPIFEHEASASIGDIAVAPSNPNIVWVGTGEDNPARSTLSGTGVYKSIDAGRTWTNMGLTDTGAIARVIVHPTNPNIVYVAAAGHPWSANDMRGVFKTIDGGKTWTKLLYRSPNTGAFDLVMDKKDPNIITAALWQRGRRKWSQLRTDANYTEGGVFRSIDGGTSWLPASDGLPAPGPASNDPVHRVWVDPKNPKVIYTASDSGFSMSSDGGKTKVEATGIRAAQVSSVDLDAAKPFHAFGTVADTSVRATVDAARGRGAFLPMRWDRAPADGITRPQTLANELPLRTQPKPPMISSSFDPKTMYSGFQAVYRSSDRGVTWQRTSDDLTDGNARQMGVGTMAIPYQSITQLAESPLTKGVIYAGTDDGNLRLTKDDGASWTDIGKNLPMAMKKWVSRIVASKYDAATVFVALRGREDDDFTPYAFKSTDYGATWTSIVGNIPSGSITVVREDPSVKGVLYAGNDFGAYVSKDGGRKWDALGVNMPTVAVSDIQVHPRDHVVVIATNGRGLYAIDAVKVRAVK